MGQKRKSRGRPAKEEKPIEDSEDYCFVCKDGGQLILCDQKDCTKAYHPGCIGKELSDESDEQWICGWHSCCKCSKTSSFRCICCQKAVCKRCIINNKEFAKLKDGFGICDECLKLATMVEEEKNTDSDGETVVDFNDRESVEGLFKEYWEIMRDKENLSWKDLNTAKGYMVNGYNGDSRETKKPSSARTHSGSEEYGPKEIPEEESDKGCDSHTVPKPRSSKRGPKTQRQKRKERVFLGWGSKLLIDFLKSIGEDTSQKRSQDDVANIMINYARDKKLFDPEKKKKINLDAAMQKVLGRKSMTIYKIKDFLESHLLEHMDNSDEDEQGYSSEDEDLNSPSSPKTLKKHRTSTTWQEKDFPSKKLETEDVIEKEHKEEDNKSPVVSYRSPFASIVPDNIKLVYLRRSLLEELAEMPETFDQKVIGSFVKFKSNAAIDYKRRYQLLQVLDVVKPDGGDKASIVLKLAGLSDDVLISMLSDDDFSKEECDELRLKVEDGIIERPTVIDLQEKVKILHEDITKHSMARELIILQHRIDLANEKGRRDLFYQCVQRRKVLQAPEERVRRLRMVPEVTADVIIDSEPVSKDSVQDDPSKL